MTPGLVMTPAQREVIRWLLAHPGRTIFEYYDNRRGGSFGMERVSVRGAAGRMKWRLVDAGWLTSDQIVTPAGEEEAI